MEAIATKLREIAGWTRYLEACEKAGNVFEADCTEMHLADLRQELVALFA